MSAASSRLFVCDVLPTTCGRAFGWVTVIGLTLAAGVVASAVGVGFVAPGLQMVSVGFAAAAMLSFTRGNPILRHYREYECARGTVSPEDCIRSAHWPWVAVATGFVLLVSPSPVLAVLAIYSALFAYVRWMSPRFQRSLAGVVREYIETMFVYLAYPDRRYSGIAGCSGVWLPGTSVTQRMLRAALHLAPLYACLMGAVLRWQVESRSPANPGVLLIGSTLLLALAPHGLLFAAQLRPLADYLPLRQSTGGAGNEWEQAVDLVSNSTQIVGDHALADHFFIGWYLPSRAAANHPFKSVGRFDLPGRVPALLHRSILQGHVHLLGSSQSRKTSIGLSTLLIQILRGWNERALDAFGRPIVDGHGNQCWARSKPMPVLIIDMKGDLALFNTVREECRRSGQTFKYCTLSRGLATSYFNALPNLGIRERHVAEFSELVLNALSLFHGLSYGRSYYSKQSRDLLLKTLKGAPRCPESWEELHDLLLTEIDPKKHKDVFELVSSIFALAQYPVLGPAPTGADVIHMPTVIADRQVVYFNLPARLSAVSARDVGKLALFAFVTAAADWNDRREERRSVIFLDEAQIICSSNLATLFQQCSGAKTSMVFSNQARSDLNVPDAPQLGETVRVNTRFKQMFTVADPMEAADLIRMSGDRIGILRTFAHGTDGMGRATSGLTQKETLYTILTQNDINAVNNDPAGSLIHVMTDAGLTQLGGIPRHIQTPYPLDAAEYRRRLFTPWSDAPEVVQTVGGPARTFVNVKGPEEVQQQAEQDYAELMDFFRRTALRAGRTRMRDWVEPAD